MSEEEGTLRANEEADYAELLADQAAERSSALLRSHLKEYPCRGCGRGTLAVPEHAHDAVCGTCLRSELGGAGAMGGPITAVQGSAFLRRYEFCVCGFDIGTKDHGHAISDGHPAPLITSRDAWPAVRSVPSAVLKLEALAREASWDTEHAYSRGYAIKQYRGAWVEEECISVRFGAHPMTAGQAVAVYRTIVGRESWSWKSVWLWGPDLPPFGQGGVTELSAWLLAAGDMPAAWYEEIKARRAAAAVRAKAATVKKATKEGLS